MNTHKEDGFATRTTSHKKTEPSRLRERREPTDDDLAMTRPLHAQSDDISGTFDLKSRTKSHMSLSQTHACQ